MFIHDYNKFNTYILLIISLSPTVIALDLRECNRGLGMENGKIRDEQLKVSSSYDEQSTGPQHSRIRTESGSGAWCPSAQINANFSEWIEVVFESNTLITAIETQGRFGMGEGQEFSSMYRIEYKREGMGPYAKYIDASGNELIKANTDTRTAVLVQLGGAIIATRVRLFPVSPKKNPICLRFELYGCKYRDIIEGYTMTGSDTIDGLNLKDFNFDGNTNETIKYPGFGKLFDGKIGEDDFDSKPQHWIGWKKNAVKGKVDMTFYFSEIKNISAISLYVNNFYKQKAYIFKKAVIKFSSTGSEKNYSTRKVDFFYEPDLVFFTSRWVRIPIPNRLAKIAKIELHFAKEAELLLISEVKFESNLIMFDAIDEDAEDKFNKDDNKDIINIDTSNALTYFEIKESQDDASKFFFIVIIAFVLLALFICLAAIYMLVFCKKPTSQKSLLPLFKKQGVQMIMNNDESIKRTYSLPKSAANNLDSGSDYAEPDYSICAEQPLLTNGQYYSSTHYKGSGTLTSNLSQTSSTISSPPTVQKFTKIIDEQLKNLEHIVQINPAALIYIEMISDGKFGPISLCKLEHRLVAVKKLHSNAAQNEIECFKKELVAMSTLKHQNILEVIGICGESNSLCCIIEYMKNGDLRKYLQSQPYSKLTPEFLISISVQIAAGMSYLESQNFVHSDLSLTNCYVSDDFIVKIGNLGMARSLYSTDNCTFKDGSNKLLRWMSWESALLGRYSIKSSVWNFGVVLWATLMGGYEKPFGKLTDEELIKNFESIYHTGRMSSYLPRPRNCDSSLYELLQKCWQREEQNRPSFSKIHIFLQNLTFKQARPC
uniref:Protein kinase domain-containing protein n=1 Tax=Rhabditophanes sp. KR3021 TaxID=114890 RepID=A0AC35UG57_9BILA